MKKLSLEEIAKEEELHVQRIEQESQPKERFVKLTFLIATEGDYSGLKAPPVRY